MIKRRGERGRLPQRQERFFAREDYWYYRTREGVEMGPFDSREAAMMGCARFISHIRRRDPSLPQALRHYTKDVPQPPDHA